MFDLQYFRKMDSFGKRTTILRKSMGMTQKQFAIAGDFSQSNLSLLENDGVIPNLGLIITISEKYPNINLNWWIQGRGEMFIKEQFEEDDLNALSPGLRKFLIELRTSVNNISASNRNLRNKRKK